MYGLILLEILMLFNLLGKSSCLKKAINDWNRIKINNPNKEFSTLSNELAQIRVQLTHEPHNDKLWLKQKDLQYRNQELSIEQEVY